MASNDNVVTTVSEKTSSIKYVRKTAVQLKIRCRVEKFEALMNSTKPGEGRLWSEGVSYELAPGAVWKLSVYPNGECYRDKGNLSANIILDGRMKGNPNTTYHTYLISGADGTMDSIGRSIFNRYTVSHERVKKALHADGSLLVAADIEFFLPHEYGAKAIDEGTLQGYEVREQWATKISEFHGDEASSDCTIKIGGASIPAHKSFLMAQSPIFRSMFTHKEAEEFQSSVVEVIEFKEPKPMRAVLRYCHTGQLDTETMDGEGAVEIFKLADRYCVAGLKALLEQHFINKRLSKETVVAMAVLADMHSAAKLKEACIKLIASEGSAVFEIAMWKERSEEELIAEVFQLASKYHIAELGAQLEKHFVKRLTVENVVSMAVLADTNSAQKLKEACSKLIAQKWKTVSASAAWKKLEEANAKLALKLAAGALSISANLLAEK